MKHFKCDNFEFILFEEIRVIQSPTKDAFEFTYQHLSRLFLPPYLVSVIYQGNLRKEGLAYKDPVSSANLAGKASSLFPM